MDDKKKKDLPKTKLTRAQQQVLKNSVIELLGTALAEDKNPELKKETKNVFLKYAINSRFLNN